MGYRFKIDPNVAAFIDVTDISNGSQFSAINYLVLALKANNLWSKLLCVYPFIGGTAITHRYNLKNPLSFQITFNGGITHNANGITTNGTNGYLNTGYIPASNTVTNNESIGLYSRTAAGSGVAGTAVDMGVVGTGGRSLFSLRAASGGDIGINQINDSVATYFNSACSDARGLHVLSRTSSTLLQKTQNGSLVAQSTASNGGVIPTGQPIYIGCRNNGGVAAGFVARNFSLAFMGQGLNNLEVSDLYSIIQNYQTMLSRAV